MDKIYQYMDWPRIEAIIYGEEAAPKDVMGPRVTADGVLVQCFFPEAASITVRTQPKGTGCPMERQDEAGYFAALLPGKQIPAYTYEVSWEEGAEPVSFRDPYGCPCQISDMDERRFLEGIHYEIYEKLGAHPMEIDGVKGVYFAVWAPNAQRVSVVGDFNQWDGRRCPMHRMPASGIFELFLPDIPEGAIYKYELKLKNGEISLKADPYAYGAELPPAGASRVWDLRTYQWQDEAWSKGTKAGRSGTPLSICEVDLAEWAEREGADTYEALGTHIVSYVTRMGYTHVELHPVMEYKQDAYATSAYYAPTSRYGSPTDFMAFVDRLHQAGLGVILDWTPAQFPADSEGLSAFDGTCLYENEDIRRKYHPMWGTLLYQYGSPLVRNFLIGNAFFWMRQYHIDGLRMDDVDAMLYLDYGREEGQWSSNLYGTNENLEAIEFLKHLNSVLRKANPDFLLIAQEDGLWPELTGEVDERHMGFDYKWNTGWTQAFVDYIRSDFSERSSRHDELTLSMLYAYCEGYVLTLGSREVGSAAELLAGLPGEEQQKEAGLRAALSYQICHPGAKMQLDLSGAPEGIQACAAELLRLYREKPALHRLDEVPEGFTWVQLMKYEENIITFLRKTEQEEDTLLVVLNFSPENRESHDIGVPYPGKYKEIFNSDAAVYGGSGYTNPRVKMSKKDERDDREYSIHVKVPALGCSIYSYTRIVEELSDNKEARRKETVKKPAGRRKNLKQELARKMQTEKERAEGKK